MALVLNTIVCSTRPGRVGLPVANWFHQAATAHGGFDARLVDLAEVGLPVYDEPKHPRLRDYTHEHTKRWSALVDAADAYVFVTPEYNFGSPPALVNALNYVFHEWGNKPAAFVSYGGISGGLRSVQMTKQIITTLRVAPINDAVIIPMVAQQVKDGSFTPNQLQTDSAKTLLDELLRWAEALKPLRA